MTAAPVLRRAPWALPLLVAVLVCGGAGPAYGDGTWTWPLQPAPRVVRPFDPPSKEWSAGHRGVDLRARPGQPVLAPAAGRVVFSGEVAGRGVVVVEIDGLRATFEPVWPAVAAGRRVVAGEVVGHLRLTQSHCLPAACLHWGVKHGDDVYTDPLALVGEADIVLLPFLDPAPGPVPTVSPAGWSAGWSAGSSAGSAGRPTAWSPGTPGSGMPVPATGAADTAVRFALAQIGDPYVWAAAGPDAWDCSGLTMAAWAAAGRTLPHYSAAQYLSTTPIAEEELRPGDLVFWSGGSAPSAIFHVAMYLGNGQVVHAPRPGTQVRIEGMRSWDEPDYFGRV